MLRFPDKIECRFTLELTDVGKDFVDELRVRYPEECPACGFTHPRRMFVSTMEEPHLHCDRCGYVLTEADIWPSEIEK